LKFLVISILWNQLCLLFARNGKKNTQYNCDYAYKYPVTFLEFH